jgi:hypothetical protein
LLTRYWQAPGLEFPLRTSRILLALACALVLLALAGIWSSDLSWPACATSSVASVILAYRSLADHYKVEGDNASCLVCENGHWRLRLQSGQEVYCTLEMGSLVLPALLILRLTLATEARPRTLLLAGDSATAEQWRCLQLNLRQGAVDDSG